MLQPTQPMGQPNMAATGPQTAKPQMPGMPGGQKPTMPAGQMLSSVVGGGLGSILDSVAQPYAGKPEVLEQKGMNGDLLAALAAQRLKAQKEAAMREMQLKAGGQQGGQPQKTVVEQNEDALLDLTKQEMQAEQVDTLQQKHAQQQQGQQRLMQAAMNPQQGIAGIPAPNAAEPKAMAAGGIVAFQQGGGTGYDPSDPYHVRDRLEAEREAFREKYGFDPENTGLSSGVGTRLANALGGTSEEALALNKYRAMKEGAQTAQQSFKPPAPKPADVPQQNVADTRPEAPIQNAERIPGGAVRPPQRPAPQGVPGGGVAGDSRNAVLEKAMIESMKQDPRATAEASRESAYKFLQPDEADMKSRREGLASLQALNAAENDPDRQWTRRVLRALPSKGTSFMANTMGQLGEGALAARDEEYARQLTGIGNEQKLLKGIMEDVYKPKKEASDVGSKTEQFASSEKTHGMAAAAQIKNAEMQAAVSAANNAAMAAERALTRESNDANRNLQIYRESQANLDTALKNIDANYTKAVQNMGVVGTAASKEQKAQMLQLQMDRDNARAALNERYGPLIEQAGRRAGMADGLGSLGTDPLKDYKITGSRPTQTNK